MNKTDNLIIFVASMAILFSLYKTLWTDATESDGKWKVAGHVLHISNVVKQKHDEDLTWGEAAVNGQVYLGDMVYTHSDSTVRIVTEQGIKISMMPDCLIKFDKNFIDGGTDVLSGIATINLPARAKAWQLGKLKVKSNKGAIIQLEGRKNISGLSIIKGGLEIISSGTLKKAPVKLKKGERLELDTKKKKIISKITVAAPELQLPELRARLNLDHVTLKWEGRKRFDTFSVEVFKGRPATRNRIVNSMSEETSYALEELGSGTYFWRITGIRDGARVKSPMYYFNVKPVPKLSRNPVIPVYPKPGQKVSLDKDNLVNFQWKFPPNSIKAESYRFELRRWNGTRGILVFEKNVKKQNLKLKINFGGDFFWRVLSEIKDGRVPAEKSPASMRPSFFKVKGLPDELPPPEIEMMIRQEVPVKTSSLGDRIIGFLIPIAWATEDPAADGLEISWPKVQGAKGYVVRIYSDPAAKNQVVETTTQTSVFNWSHNKPGEYYYRVATINQAGHRGSFSSVGTIVIEGFEVTPVKLKSMNQNIKMDAIEDVFLSWENAQRAHEYEVTVRGTKDGQKSRLVEKTKNNSITVPKNFFSKTGKYSWNVKTWYSKSVYTTSDTGTLNLIAPKPIVLKKKIVKKPKQKKYEGVRRKRARYVASMSSQRKQKGIRKIRISPKMYARYVRAHLGQAGHLHDISGANSLRVKGVTVSSIAFVDFQTRFNKTYSWGGAFEYVSSSNFSGYSSMMVNPFAARQFKFGNFLLGVRAGITVKRSSKIVIEDVQSKRIVENGTYLTYGPSLGARLLLGQLWYTLNYFEIDCVVGPLMKVQGKYEAHLPFKRGWSVFLGGIVSTEKYKDDNDTIKDENAGLMLGLQKFL